MDRALLPNYIGREGARFESTKVFNENSAIVNTTEPMLDYSGIPMIKINDEEFATTKKELHGFIIGESGCGKTRRIILPTIHFLAKTGESMVVSDPKGELYRKTSEMLRKNGYNVYVLNFRNPARGNRWNPLGMIEELYRKGDLASKERDKALKFLMDIASVLYSSATNNAKDTYWINSAKSVFLGVSLFILEYGEEGDLTFENIANVTRRLNDDINKNNKSSSSLLSILSDIPATSPITNNLSPILNNAESTRNCIISEFEVPLSLYLGQDLLMDLFCNKSEIDVLELGKKPTALFFVLPDDSDALYPIATVFIQQIYSTLIDFADSHLNGVLPNRVTFLLDEFANFARLPSIASMLTAARSRGIRFVLVCQSMSQLEEKYGKSGQETLLSNCRVWIYMSCKNIDFIDRVSKLAGDYESPYTGEKRPLISHSELLHFEMGEVLIFNDRCRPIRGHLPDYSEYKFGDNGESIEVDFPESHALVARKHFNISDAIRKAALIKDCSKMINKNSARSAVFDDIMNAVNNAKSISAVADASAGMDLSSIPSTTTVRELFESGKIYAAAQQCINRMGKVYDDMATIGYLAFFIRHGKLDTSKLKADFSLDMTDLLKKNRENGDDFALINAAMTSVAAEDYAGATQLFNKMTRIDCSLTYSFWFECLWTKMNSPDGALFGLVVNRLGYLKIDTSVLRQMYDVAQNEYKSFLQSEEFESLGSGNK